MVGVGVGVFAWSERSEWNRCSARVLPLPHWLEPRHPSTRKGILILTRRHSRARTHTHSMLGQRVSDSTAHRMSEWWEILKLNKFQATLTPWLHVQVHSRHNHRNNRTFTCEHSHPNIQAGNHSSNRMSIRYDTRRYVHSFKFEEIAMPKETNGKKKSHQSAIELIKHFYENTKSKMQT